jgi:hypothetical protein
MSWAYNIDTDVALLFDVARANVITDSAKEGAIASNVASAMSISVR